MSAGHAWAKVLVCVAAGLALVATVAAGRIGAAVHQRAGGGISGTLATTAPRH